jgi:hypothetical protein
VSKLMGEGPFNRFARVKRPVARDEDLLVEHLADETVIYDERTKEAHALSPLASVVFANCDGETTMEQLAALATERLGEPVDEAGVVEALVQLQERDLLAVPPRGDLTRRQMIGKSAVAAGAFAGASLITTIVAPAAIAGGSATCANILCCPCCTASNLNKEDCCTTPLTRNCQCVNASNGQREGPPGFGIIEGGKFCKTTGAGAPTDAQCIGTEPIPDSKPPNTWCTACYPFTVIKTGACGTCSGPDTNC